jgi:hypothetical protein
MDFCLTSPRINVRSASSKNNIPNKKNNMAEVDVVSGFQMDTNEPSITIENTPERPIISLNDDGINLVDDIGIISDPIFSNPTPVAKAPIVPTVPKSQRKQQPEITKLPQRKREDSFGSSSAGSLIDTFKEPFRDSPPEPANVPFDFGDIADPVKHKPVEEVKYDDNGYSSGGGYSGGASEASYSKHQSSSNNYTQPQPQYGGGGYGQSYGHDESEGDRYRREDEEKQELLIKLQGLESRGVRLTREFSMKSRLDDIRFEYEKQKSYIEKDASVDFMKNMLITFVHGTEIMNDKWDPVGAKLSGWSESVMENIGSYETIFERLHEKYQGSVDVAPELELLMTLASSAFMFHMMQSLFKNAAPNLGNAVMQDPNLMAGLGQAAARAADMTNKQSQGLPTPSNQNMSGPSQGFDISSLLSGMGPLMGMMGGSGGGMMGGPQRPVPTQAPPPVQQSSVQHAFQNPPPRPIDPRNEPTLSNYGQQNFTSPGQQNFKKPSNDDDANSRLTDFSDDDLSVGSGVRISRNKSHKKTIHF